jgi:hypothetical protein
VTGYENDGRFPDGSQVRVRYPLPGMTADTPRESWPWMAGTIELQGGPDEWTVLVQAREVAELADGTRAPEGTPEDEVWCPLCFRDASELCHTAAADVTRTDLDAATAATAGAIAGPSAGPLAVLAAAEVEEAVFLAYLQRPEAAAELAAGI